MVEINRTYHPEPDKIINFIKLQVADAMLNDEIFEDELNDHYASVLFALALLATVPPVPANRALLNDTFSYMEKNFGQGGDKQFSYEEIAKEYNRLLPVFQKSASLPKQTPMSNPYDEVAQVAAFDFDFGNDGIRLFNLKLWITHYCRDAMAMFYTDDVKKKSRRKGGYPMKMPAPAEAYEFVSMHVNYTVEDVAFFPEGPPSAATEVMTSMFLFFALMLPTQSNALLMDTLEYTNELLTANNFTPTFFDRIVNGVERFSSMYESNLNDRTHMPNYYTVDKIVDEALRMMNAYPDLTLKMNIVSYLPTLINDALSTLFSE